ncbi:MAG: Smr/MutS family protein [Paraprevotella sp.]|nr:Smr/MutS family protein [Paraprevotella sp.]
MIYPQNFEQKIGFDEIRTLLAGHCLSPLGTERVEQMKFLTDVRELRERQAHTREFLHILEGEEDFPEQDFYDVRPSIRRIRIEGTYLDETELFDLKRSLSTIIGIVAFLDKDETKEEDGTAQDYTGPYPALRRLAQGVAVFPQLVRRIDSILDKYGKIKDSASAEQLRIRRELTATESGISRTMNSILRLAQQDGVVEKDVTPTLRDGRLVIPVAPALKRKIKGIVHDESATGRTVYIEPSEVVEANNRIRELEGEERREIIRILQEITAEVRPCYQEILQSYEFLADIDFIRAKARLALQFDAITPEIKDIPLIDWTLARHPLLALSLTRHGKKVVPIDIELSGNRRILIISGPNAGGKSVCLKTVGLIQYMLQCGLPVPIGENSRTGLFNSIFIDIGDEQSIEDDLSTYSSHLLNMKNMMKSCGGTSLLLIDEFGGGTESQIGGAIAEAVLKRFNQKKAFGIITTHYQNLKHFAEDHEGVVNGAMLYDRQHMQALFQLQIGNPGSSFAVEIARKIGLPEDVIADASELVGKEYIHADKYLQDIIRDKRYWETKRQNIHQQEKEMEKTIARYETEIEELQRSRKEILRKAKEDAEQLLRESNAKIENTIRTIREAQAEKEKTRNVRQELNDFKKTLDELEKQNEADKIARKIQQIQERRQRRAEKKEKKAAEQQVRPDVLKEAARKAEKQNRPLQPGDTVRIKGQTSVGTIEEIEGKSAIVTFGMMRTNVNPERLERAALPASQTQNQVATYVSKQTQYAVYEKKLNFKQDIDVRGMRGDEAINAVTYFIDDAILLGLSRVRILHGTGSGILRTLIRQYLHTIPGVKDFRDEHVQFGGAGITVVDLA